MSQPRPTAPRFYFDADVLGLARLVCQERPDCTYPGDPGGRVKKRLRPPCVVTAPDAKDSVWIPAVAAQGWLIITRDSHIQKNRAEIDAVRTHRARMVNLASADASSTWAQLEVLMTRWREIERLVERPGPFIVVISRTGRLIDVDLAP